VHLTRAATLYAAGCNPTHLDLGPCNRTCQGCNPRYDDASFDVITNSLSVDYMTSPLELFGEIHRVPAGSHHEIMAVALTPSVATASHHRPSLQARLASLRAERRACSPAGSTAYS
jgi:hypothetical protein